MRAWIMCCAMLALTMAGCSSSTDVAVDANAQPGENNATQVSLTAYCGSCGHGVTGDVADHKCDTEHATCENCPFHKGSELCCKGVEDAAGKFFCAKCGDEAGTEGCCKEGAETCDNCPFHKGSALCCKLNGTADTAASEEPASDEATTPASESSE